MRPKADWPIAIRARGIIVLVKVGQKNIEAKHLALVKEHMT